MKGGVLFASLLALSLTLPSELYGQERRKSFEEFRKGILDGFSDFRSTVLDNYADFLAGEWHEYRSLNSERRDAVPKPSKVPAVDSPSEPVPKDEAPEACSPADPDVSSPLPFGKSKDPSTQARPSSGDGFSFFGIPLSLPEVEFSISHRLSSPSDYASQWKSLDRSESTSKLLPSVKRLSEELGLNDYLLFELLKAYIDAKFPQAHPSSRFSAVHYFLANLGYDARVAMSGAGDPLLLLPFRQTVYGRNFMTMPDGKYYVFAPEGYDYSRLSRDGIRTCSLPRDVEKGRKFDLVLGDLHIPVSPRRFDLEYGSLKLSGEVNENLMSILYRYPQMPISDYAVSTPDLRLRRDIVGQVRMQLGGMEGDEAVERLLEFMHHVFQYATDEEFHGFEKPYFLEETLFYPKNDCEDRAIFYTYILWNALGKEAQLISFPGHEAATVSLDKPVDGTSYEYSGKTFFVSDPTYIGSRTGMVMPVYRNESPTVDYTFSRTSQPGSR